MNYRHSFHAGNIADVFKHLVLVEALAALRAKDTPMCLMDTHAGSGLYRLESPGEFERGIGRLWPVRSAWPQLDDYFAVLGALNAERLEWYPGSPWFMARALRGQDRAVFVERHPEEAAALRDNLRGAGVHESRERSTRNSGRGRSGIAIHEADAWSLLMALVPPRENRGLVLIDPPYEQPDEYERAVQALRAALQRWRNGVYLLWYPIKARRPVEQLHRAVRTLGHEAYALEFLTLPEDVPQRLNGSGVVLVNAPWKLDETLMQFLPALAQFLAGEAGRPQVHRIDLSGRKNLASS